MTDKHESLEALAALAGLENDYFDYRGVHRQIPDETRRDILTAMGFDVSSDRRAAEAVGRLEGEPWRSILPPVTVMPAGTAGRVEICLPVSAAGGTIHWSIALEDGSVRAGTVPVAELTVIQRRVVQGEALMRLEAGLPDDLPPGYHTLSLRIEYAGPALKAATSLVASPAACYLPAALQKGQRLWGMAVQLYTLRSDHNWGIGDFGDLKRLVREAARHGVDIVGVNPLHSLFPANPAHCSPYSPSSRSALNVLYIDVSAAPDFRQCESVTQLVSSSEFRAARARVRASELVDYEGVAQLKFPALRLLFAHFQAEHILRESAQAKEFTAFVREGGPALERIATYDALHAHFCSADSQVYGFRDWPLEYRDPRSEAVTNFAMRHRQAIDYYLYLQWLADRQLAAVQATALGAGMEIGIYRDLAVGVDPGGADAWADQDLYCAGASVGAPPDPLALQGQDWGLPPMDPRRLRESGYRAYTQLLQSNFRHCGALRIDHVMALLRLWWLLRGGGANKGVYVYYPFEDLLGILALESQRAACLVVGEDLGTVPDRIRAALPAARVLSYRVMIFEKHGDGSLKGPHEYPYASMATVSTHDLPTLYGFWEGADIPLRDRLGLFPDEQLRADSVAGRAADRQALLQALASEDLLPPGVDAAGPAVPTMTPELAGAIQIYLARSRSALMVTQPEDWIAERRPVNVPGTSDEYPNWRRKLTVTVEELFRQGPVRALTARLVAARGGQADTSPA